MFGWLFGKKNESNEDQWTVATAQDGDMPLIFRIRSVSGRLNRSDYPNMIAISWPYEPQEMGMPSPETKTSMDLLEDLLTRPLESGANALLTVVVTGNGVREWQWYTRSQEETMSRVNSALAGQPPFPVEFSVQHDPGWQAYSQFET